MALPDYFKHEHGTAIIWGESGASGVTHVLSLNNLADGAGRMGAAADLNSVTGDWDQWFMLGLRAETGSAPGAGTALELYLAWSYDNTNWPGKVTGSDAAYPATVADNKKQLGMPAHLLVSTADANTVLIQNPVLIRPQARYVVPVVVNLLGQALRNEGTPANNDSRVLLVPYRTFLKDTA